MRNITRLCTAVISCLFVCTSGSLRTLHDSTAAENIEIRVFNHEYKATVKEVLRRLERTDLELRGFTKSVINNSVSTSDEEPIYSTLVHFDKAVPCQQLLFVEREIRHLMPEVWGVEVSKRVHSTVSRLLLNGGKSCTAGIEIHLPLHRDCAGKNTKKSICSGGDWCMFCFRGTVTKS